MDKFYEQLNDINNNEYDLEEIQKYKIIYTLQKIFEEVFSKIYLKIAKDECINAIDKFSFLFIKLFIKMTNAKAGLSFYMKTLEDKQIILNNKHYLKLLTKNIENKFRTLLINLSYKILHKFLPHTTNAHLYIIDEDNYKNIKCPVELNQNIVSQIISPSFFFEELCTSEKMIFNYLFISVEYFYTLGKRNKAKALNDIQIQDISRIKNSIKLSYIFSSIIKYFYEKYEIKQYSNIDETIKNIIINLLMLNYLNLLIYGKTEKNMSSIFLYYFIKYEGVKYIFKISKKFLFLCKEELSKKEIPMVELLIIKSFWNMQISILLFLIKYSFHCNNNFYSLLILEHDLVHNFISAKELDAYVKFLILNTFFEIFFDENDINYNINIIKDMETYSNELARMMYILYDNCCRVYNTINNINKNKKEKINLNELYNKGYYIYEIMQVIQEGNDNNEDISKTIDEYRMNLKQNEELKKQQQEKEIININSDNNEKKTLNKILNDLEQLNIENDKDFLNNINNIFPLNKKLYEEKNKNISYTKENFLKSLNYLYDILSKCDLSYKKINEMKKMNIKYRIKSFGENEDLLSYIKELNDEINKIREEKNKNKEEIIKKELSYLSFMNYSILRYKKFNKNSETFDNDKYICFIYDNNIIENSANSIKEILNMENEINLNVGIKLIYEHFLRIYNIFCFLDFNKKISEKEKIIFLDVFLLLLKKSNKNKNLFLFNQAIIILCLLIINRFFNYNDNSQEILNEYLIKKKLFEYLLELKFNCDDANINFYDNNFKYFVTLEECFKQFIFKIFSEKKSSQYLLQNIFKYIIANLNPDNNEIELENFIDICNEFIKEDNKDIFINTIKNLFNIIEKEENFDKNKDKDKENNKIYLLRLKPEFNKDIEIIKEKIKKGEINTNTNVNNIKKEKEELIISNKEIIKNNLFNNISEKNKILFNILLYHIYKTSEIINKSIPKKEKYQKITRNYLFDLDTNLSGLNTIISIYPSFLYLIINFKEINFIKYLINTIFPLMNYYYYCISWPEHVSSKEDLVNNNTKERKDILRAFNNYPNSYHSFLESFRNNNIIISLIHSLTYKKRNMIEEELNLINRCRKEILDEINIILNDINEKNNFNLLYQNYDLLPKNVIYFKSCLIILYSMSDSIDENDNDIYDQFNPFEIAALINSKEYNIINNIANILKNMKINEKNGIFHNMGIKYLNKLFKYIQFIKRKKSKKNLNNNNKEEEMIENNEESEENEESISHEMKKFIDYLDDGGEEEEEESEDEINQENILHENNAEEEELLSLIQNGEEDEEEDSNELLNNLENPFEANMQVVQNPNQNEEENENNNNVNNLEIIIDNNNNNEEKMVNYNEENILFFEYNTELVLNLNQNKIKSEEFQFYEEFITFPFLIFNYKTKNALMNFYYREKYIDIYTNMEKEFIEKANNMFIKNYLFPFDLDYIKYLSFIFIGLKDKTTTSYYSEINKIIEDCSKYFSIKNEIKKEDYNDIINKLKQDNDIIKELNDNNNKNIIIKEKEKEKEKEDLSEDNSYNEIKNVVRKLSGLENNEKNNNINNDIHNKEKEENINEIKNENNNIQFIFDLNPKLREDILRDLPPDIIGDLPPELQNEYNRIVNKDNEFNVLKININIHNQQTQENYNPKKIYELQKLKYKRDTLLNIYYNNNYEKNLIKIFDDEFIENLIIYNLKSILVSKKKQAKIMDEYILFINKLMLNEILMYKILDIFFIIWIVDTSFLFDLLKKEKFYHKKNNFLNQLHILFIKSDLIEEFFYNDFEQFFTNFAKKNKKFMKQYFLQSFFNEKGEYILKSKIFNITENSKKLKKILNIQYNLKENVLNNLINLTLIKNNNAFKRIISLKIFTTIIQNCLKHKNKQKIFLDKNNNNELNISNETIEKILNLFNNFDITFPFRKEQRSNEPTLLLIEIIKDKNIFQILLNALIKRIKELKESIAQEMEDFFKNKKINIILYNNIFPDIFLFKLVKFINSLSAYFNERIKELEKDNKKKDENELNIKKEKYKQLKHFIKDINNILFSCWEQLNNLLTNINTKLKDNQIIIIPKLNRLIPYLEIFTTLSHLQFISTHSLNNFNNNPFIFEKKFDSEISSSPPSQCLSLVRLNSKNEVDYFVEFFYEFCEKNKKIINYILHLYPRMFTDELIKKISPLLDLENKKKYFRHSLKKLPSTKNNILIKVGRNGSQLFTDSFDALYDISPLDLRGNLIVVFKNEEAVDEGGVKREWLTLLTKEMFNPNYMLFTLAKNGTTYTINSDSGKYNDDHLKYFEFIGKIMAKAIFDGMMIDCYFTRVIYKLITATPISYHDMEDYDPVYYNSIKWLLENDFTGKETLLTYSYDHDNLGEIKTVDLIENGRNIDVTEGNKFEYVQRLCSSKLYDSIKLQIESLLKGFYDIIPQNLISIFNHRELELVISGMPTIDIKDWKNNTIYENYNEESNVIKFFWEIIESFDNDERAEFLQFVTGSAKVPLEGFSALQGIGGINKFKITKVFDKNFERLPTAHTCTNQLDLPDYPSKELLNEKLRLAIKEGKNSFGFI